MALYVGTQTVQYDNYKHCFHLPSKFHKRPKNPLPEAFYASTSDFYQCLLLFPFAFENLRPIRFDQKTRRITLPQDLEDFLGVKDQLTILGNGCHLELWLPEKDEKYRKSPQTAEEKQQMWRNYAFTTNNNLPKPPYPILPNL